MVPEEYRDYIGIIYPPPPSNLSEGFGMVIDPAHSPEWSLQVMRDGNVSMLWLSKLAYRDLKGGAHWQVSDILVLPKLREDEVLIPSGCKVGNTLDVEIVVIALLDQDAYVSRYVVNAKVKMAWRANQTTGAFESMMTNGIECFTDNAVSLIWTTPTPKVTP
jgi:hypothetical protein